MVFLTAQTGILYPFCWLLGKILNFIYIGLDAMGIANLGLCIIFFTLVIKLILLPFTLRQQKGSKINQYIQPEIQKVQKKYKNKTDQESMLKQQQEIQAVYKKYGTSMTNGCLVSFIQLPIIYALYRVIYNIPAYIDSVKEMYNPISEQIAKIPDFATELSTFVTDERISTASRAVKTLTNLDMANIPARYTISDYITNITSQFSSTQWMTFSDKFASVNPDLPDAITTGVEQFNHLNMFLGMDLSEAPGWFFTGGLHFTVAMLIPILAALFQFLSSLVMQNTQSAVDSSDPASAQSANMMKSMTYTMPIMSLFFCVSLPASVGIYWTISSLITFLTQLGVNLYYDKIADKDKILEKQMEKAKKKNAKKKNKKSFTERLMEAAGAADQTQTSSSNSVANTNLKSYSSTNNSNSTNQSNTNTSYKKGSIASKANIMQQYNNSQDNKEE
jgi:YidC/Oxa1 family membrane protein insertase